MPPQGPAELVRKIGRLASLPEVYLRLHRVLSDPRSSAEDAARAIAEDPGLTARLLRIVNSAIYGLPQQVDTVTQAIRVVGTSQLLDLALATAVTRLFRQVPRGLLSMEEFWRHGLACAIGTRTLAAHRAGVNLERFFVAGILHDIGRPVLFLTVPDVAVSAMLRSRETGELLHEVERELLGFDHAEVGAALLAAWNLPMGLRIAARGHHDPDGVGASSVEAAAVHVADVLVNALELGSSGERLVPQLSPGAWQRLGLEEDCLPVVLDAIVHQYHEVVSEVFLEVA